MSLYRELSYDDAEIDAVKGVQFGIMGPEEIRAGAVCEITATELYNGTEPVQGGLFDVRMGVIDHNRLCKTCQQRNTMCPGHYGSIALAKPVFYVQYFEIVKKLLRCVCFRCSKLLVDLDKPNVKAFLSKRHSRQKRWEFMHRERVGRCGAQTIDGCGAKQPNKVTKEGILKIAFEWAQLDGAGDDDEPAAGAGASAATKIVLTAEDVQRILRRITDADCEILGFHPRHCRPEWLLCTVLPVPPPSVRPSVRDAGGHRCEDDLTHCLLQILKTNNTLRQRLEKGATRDMVDVHVSLLQYHVASLIDNSGIAGGMQSRQRTGRPLRALMDRLKGKEGRIRGNLMGKRVDFSARSVITPDPNISIDELGVPLKIAMNLTFPEVVNAYTRDALRAAVDNGPAEYPGAKFLRKALGGRVIVLANVPDRPNLELEPGDIVDRHLRDGDIVLFNRQPSLHKMSMMAHRVRVMPYDTFRLNVCVCPVFNSDFDGDEMNMHVPQSAQTHEELLQLAAVSKMILTPRQSIPLISIVQDITCGVYKISQADVRISKKRLFNIIASNPRAIRALPTTDLVDDLGNPVWSGHHALSTTIPPNINLRVKNKRYDDDKEGGDEGNVVVVRNGVMVQGVCDKDVYQKQTAGLVHSIYNENGHDEARQFFDNTQRVVCEWLMTYGMSVGISDLVLERDTLAMLRNVIDTKKAEVYDTIWDMHANRLENTSTLTNSEFFENSINNILNDVLNEVGKIASKRELASGAVGGNRMVDMIQSGAKGRSDNFGQMIGALGQVNVEGKRIPYGFEHRTLPHFSKFDDAPEARGFVSSSFVSGLSPHEFFFHAMGGREGLIDTAVKSVTGDTPIVVLEDGAPKRVLIGDWIDAHLAARAGDVKRFPEDRDMELLDLDRPVYVPTADAHGRVTWGELTAVTRHDPGARLYKVTTCGGRIVTVAESQSLLIWDDAKRQFLPKPSPEVAVGDFVPVTAQLEEPPPSVARLSRDAHQLTRERGTVVGRWLAGSRDAGGCPFLEDAPCDRVPDVAFAAPEAFVVGLLDGYVDTAGSVSRPRDCSTCTLHVMALAPRLLEGLAMLCSRIGVFAEILPQQLRISGRWAVAFAAKLMPGETCFFGSAGVEAVEDVVKDKIAAVEVVGVEAYPKLYDVTVPSTLNFGLANGLIARDTSSSGYLQRKLIKAMEDCKIAHDHTVRDANGGVVQFLFGEDGIDPIRRERQALPYVDQSLDEVQAHHLFFGVEELRPVLLPATYAALQKAGDGWRERVYAHYEAIVEDRRFLIQDAFRGDPQSSITYPVAFKRIMDDAKAAFGADGADALTDLTPDDVLDVLDELTKTLYVVEHTRGDRLIGLLLRLHLSPKNVLLRYRFNKITFAHVVGRIKERFAESLAHPGEMVGIVAAQSLGEPVSQLSASRSTTILIKTGGEENGGMYHGCIGDFVDKLLAERGDNVVDLGNDSVVLDLAPGECSIVGVSNSEKTSWRDISQVSRHPANGGMVRIHTKSGKSTCATLSHSFLKRATNGIVPVKGTDLKVGDRVPLAKHIPEVQGALRTLRLSPDLELELDFDAGWLAGAYIADGWVTSNQVHISKKIPEFQERIVAYANKFDREVGRRVNGWGGVDNYFHHPALARYFAQFGVGSHNKRVPAFVFGANTDFIAGVVSGYHDGDGNVNCSATKQVVRTASVSEGLIDDMILLQAYFDIFSAKGCNFKHELKVNGEERSDQFTTATATKYAPLFQERIGLKVLHKAAKLAEAVAYTQREDAYTCRDELDAIPALGETLAAVGQLLVYPQQSRTFARYLKKESIGRRTLQATIDLFERTIVALESPEVAAHVASIQLRTTDSVPLAMRAIDDALGWQPKYGPKPAATEADPDPVAPTLRNPRPSAIIKFLDDVRRARANIPAARQRIAVLRQAAESDVVWDEIVELEHLPDPGEYVYDFTVPGNDSFMVDCGILVHNTLNSVHHDEELLLLRDGNLERVRIGEFADAVVDDAREGELEDHPRDTKLAYLRRSDVKVLSCDEDGKIAWQQVEAVTRHPVVNADGSNTLIKVTTHSGRTVIATKGKSFLKRVNNKIVGVDGADLRVDDYLPVSRVLPTREVAPIDFLDMSLYLPKTEYVYMTEVEKALAYRRSQVGLGDGVGIGGVEGEADAEAAAAADAAAEGVDAVGTDTAAAVALQTGQKIRWFDNGGRFTVPYKRGDSLMVAFLGTAGRPATNTHYRSGCMYPLKTMGKDMVSHIPERIPLDAEFGWLVGAYLSEGCLAVGAPYKGGVEKPYGVMICNMSDVFHERVHAFCERHDIGYHVDEGTRQMASGYVARTKSLRMHCLLLGEAFMKLFGRGAANKRVHPSLFGAPDEFLEGLVDGYFSGDGCASGSAASLTAYSASRGLLEDMQQILTRFDIQTCIRQLSEEAYERKRVQYNTMVRGWTMSLSTVDTIKFAERFTLCIDYKNERLQSMTTRLEYGRNDFVPDIVLSTGTVNRTNRVKVMDLQQYAANAEDLAVLRAIEDEEIVYDRVMSIEELANDQPWVYDLTVANTRTFDLYNGLGVFDTFHFSGISSASTAVRGVPRLEELLRLSKDIKTPIMTIHVAPEFAADKTKCKAILDEIETTHLRDLVRSSKVYFDPDDAAVAEDGPMLAVYKEWRDKHPGMCPVLSRSPWLLRLEFDKAAMLDKGITLLDVERVLFNFYDDSVSCVFSDDNAAQLACRIRLSDEGIDDALTDIKALEQTLMEDKNMVVRGVDNVRKASMEKKNKVASAFDAENDAFVEGPEWVISTAGTNLAHVLTLPTVDAARTTTNDVVEVLNVLGIEAARQALHNEIMAVLADVYVNYCHVSLLIDIMTNRGRLTSIDRHGINRTDIGPLAKSSFETVKDVLIKSGVFGEYDRMTGVSANVMLGQIPKYGTGFSEIFVDPSALVGVEEDGRGTAAAQPAAATDEADSQPITAEMFAIDFEL